MIITSIGMVLALAAVFIAAVLNLALDSGFRKRLVRVSLLLTSLIGLVFYGWGYAWTYGANLTSLIRALMATCRMFAGINDLGSIQNSPPVSHPAGLAIFWLGHFLGFYATASATIAALGEKLLRDIRVTLLRRGTLLIVYGINSRSMAYGRRMAGEKRCSVIFVDQDCSTDFEAAAKSFGAIIEKGKDALEASPRFLKRVNLKAGKRKMELAALHRSGRKNLEYARKLLESMKAAGIHPEQTRLLASGIGAEAAALQAVKGDGYGSVYAFDEYELTARMIIRDHPPCDQISFDDRGRAAENFHAVILGFGRMGRAVLTQLVMNGQFYGSRFRVDIFDPGAQNGFLHGHPMMAAYDIRFHSLDATQDSFYSFLEENRKDVKMMILCTGNAEQNYEIAGDLAAWWPWNERMPLTVYVTRESCFWLDETRHETERGDFLEGGCPDLEEMDAMARQINYIYHRGKGESLTAEEAWRECSYADRQSSRASADFYPAVLRASGKTAEQVLAGDWPPDAETLENLAITEHLRWCAYQYANGYAAMSEEVWEQRAARYRSGAEPGFRISRDNQNRLQACLTPWEKLDELSDRENAVTGGQVDYKQMDRNNVLMLREILQARQDTEPRKEN